MSALSLRLPNSLHARVRELARREGLSINRFVATALAEELSALLTAEYLAERARRGDRRKWLAVLDRVPAAEPEPQDRYHRGVARLPDGRALGDEVAAPIPGRVLERPRLPERLKLEYLGQDQYTRRSLTHGQDHGYTGRIHYRTERVGPVGLRHDQRTSGIQPHCTTRARKLKSRLDDRGFCRRHCVSVGVEIRKPNQRGVVHGCKRIRWLGEPYGGNNAPDREGGVRGLGAGGGSHKHHSNGGHAAAQGSHGPRRVDGNNRGVEALEPEPRAGDGVPVGGHSHIGLEFRTNREQDSARDLEPDLDFLRRWLGGKDARR